MRVSGLWVVLVVEEPVAPMPVAPAPVAAIPTPAPRLTKRVVDAPEVPLVLDEPVAARPEIAAEIPPPPGSDALADGAGATGARRGLFGR